MKVIYINVLGFFCLLILQNCGRINQIEINDNKGFLTYSSGIGITEGVSIDTFSDGYILLGSTDTGNETNYYIVKVDKEGYIILSKVYLGDADLDNIPVQIIVNESDSLIYVLGNRYDRFVRRVVPHISMYHLNNLEFEREIYLDEISGLARNTTYEEVGAGFLEIGDHLYIASTLRRNDEKTIIYTYVTGSNDQSFDTLDIINPKQPNRKLNVKSIKKGKTGFYIGGTLSQPSTFSEFGRGYFIVKYDFTAKHIATWYNESEDLENFTTFLDFEVIDDENVLVFYRKKNKALLDMVNLSGIYDADSTKNINVLNSDILGEIYAVDTAFYDNTKISIIDDTKKAKLQKIDNDILVTMISPTFEVMVSKIEIDNFPSLSFPWSSSDNPKWKPYNSSILFNHTRNTIGNIIARHEENSGYAIIGTHDFLDDTKMILMQLNQYGDFIHESD